MAVVVTEVTTVPAAFAVIMVRLEMFLSHLNFHLRPLTVMFTIEMATTELCLKKVGFPVQ